MNIQDRDKLAQKLLNRQKKSGSLFPLAKKTKAIKYWARHIANEIRMSNILETELHNGVTPSTKTGDWSDVYVVTPYGKLPWKTPDEPVETMVGGKVKTGYYSVSRISDEEMHRLMVDIEKRIELTLRQCLGSINHPEYAEFIHSMLKKSLFGELGISWDMPDKEWENMNKKVPIPQSN